MMNQRTNLKVFIFNSLLAISISNTHAALPPNCNASFIPTFTKISDIEWDIHAVRKTLHAFTYGGFATDNQITTWANMPADCAIQQILSFQSTNDLLSPPGTDTLYDNIQSYLTSTNGDATLESLQNFWSSSDSNNPTISSQISRYDLLVPGSTTRLRTDSLPSTWVSATNKRGVNTFRQKVGLWLTNYHMSVHMQAVGNNPAIIRKLYDDVMRLLSLDAEGDDTNYFANILSEGAKSPAIAVQYGHRLNRYNGTNFSGNDDFAREYHQLFFGILGDGNAQQKSDYENITVENTAKMLTGMSVDKTTDYYATSVNYYHDILNYQPLWHHPDLLDDLVILGATVSNSSYPTAMDKIDYVSQVAINNSESIDNLPVWIIKHFADDTLSSEDDNNNKVIDIRNAWNNSNKNLLHFLRSYALSDQFHGKGIYTGTQRLKYRTAFDRNMIIYNQNTINNQESYINTSASPKSRMQEQGAKLFYPAHFVFGAQTGIDAANNSDIFKSAYNGNISNPNALATSSIGSWQKNWSSLIPSNLADANGQYTARDIGEWLWKRFIGDGADNYGYQEKFYVTGLLANGNTFSPAYEYEEYELDPASSQSNPAAILQLQNNENTLIDVDGNRNIGLAINFITVTPYMFAQNGNTLGQGE